MISKEKSCGAVVYKIINNVPHYLLEYMSLGHISLPKGHVEKNETEEETALREIKEETNLDVVLDNTFRKVITYSPKEGIIKDVVFFVAKVINDVNPKDVHDFEVISSKFYPFNEAYDLLTYKSDKDILKSADEFIKGEKYNG